MQTVQIGLTEGQRKSVIDLLNGYLADLHLLLVKTKKYHWDVTGPQFRTLHELWQEQYEELTEDIDTIAERIRAIGGYPIGTLQGFLEKATLKEFPGKLPSAEAMVRSLMEDREQVVRNLRVGIDRCTEELHDEGTADMLTDTIVRYADAAWMLRSFLIGDSL